MDAQTRGGGNMAPCLRQGACGMEGNPAMGKRKMGKRKGLPVRQPCFGSCHFLSEMAWRASIMAFLTVSSDSDAILCWR